MAASLVLVACGGDEDEPVATEPTASETPTTPASESETSTPVETTDVQLMMFPGLTYRLPVLIAEQEGYFDEVGIEWTEVPQPTNVQGIQGLIATDSNIGAFSIGTLVQGVQAGDDVVFICGNVPFLETTLLATPDSDLPSTSDGDSWEDVLAALSGKTIGIQTPIGSGLHLIFQSVLEAHGVTDVTYVTVGVSGPVVQAALENGDVDLAQASPTTTQQLVIEGGLKPLVYLPEGPPEYLEFFGSGWGSPRAWVEANPQAAEGFCTALGRALDWINDPANAEAAATVLSGDNGVSAEVAAAAVQTFSGYESSIDRGLIQTTLDNFIELGIMEPEPVVDAESIVTAPRP